MSDAAYMDAVAKGDMKTAQRMVDAAAKTAGYTVGPVYHGTKGKKKNTFPFTVFDTSRRGPLTTQVGTPAGSYFTPNKRYAEGAAFYASNMGRSGKPVVGAFYLRSDVEKTPGVGTEIEFFATNPSQIKSADPVTYDDSGNVIPLSQRFSSQSDDIRNPKRKIKHGLRKNPATPEDLPPAQGAKAKSTQIDTPEFKRWFNGSVVVTQSGKPRIMYHGTGFTNLGEFRSFRSRSQIAGHFAFDPKFAEEFAMQYSSQEYDDEVDDEKKRYATIYPVYLSLKKLFDVRKKEDRDEIEFEFILKRDGDVKGPNGWTWYQLEKDAVVKRMIEAGFDGFLDFEKGTKNEPTGIAAFDSPSIKSAIGNRGTFDPADPDIRNPMKTNPMDPRSSMTQIEGTKKTYAKAAKMLTGKVIDYGAGLGVGTDTLRAEGLSVDSFEPYPKKWKGKRPPTYTDSAKIPSASYDSLVSFSVINVVEPDMRKFLFQEVDRILRPNGIAFITGRDDVEKSTSKIPHLEDGGYLVGKGKDQRYQKGFTQSELERYAKEVLGSGFTIQKNGLLNGASIKISKGKTNPVTRSMIRTKLSRILEPGDRVLDYDRAQGEDLYRLWDMVHTDKPLTKEALTEIEGLLDDDGVLVIQSGEEPSGLQDHFRKATRYQGMLLVQGPMNPEEARINTEKLRRDLE